MIYIKSRPPRQRNSFISRCLQLVVLILISLLSACSDTPKTIQLEELTVAQIHEAYRSGTYTSEELIKAYLERIEKVEPILNALTIVNPNALDEARNLDRLYKEKGTLLPLHGIPVIVKDNINTRELLTTGGARALGDFIPEEDAFIIQKLKAAGAIILAKSNMAEWAFSPMHSESTTFGTTRNPYDTARVPAGSSGGTAAAIAANIGVLGLGTDTGNSIRGPSSHCSLVGFRTTIGLVSRSGIIPLYLRNDVAGPMCRTVEDATHLLDAIYGVDEHDPITAYGKEQGGQVYASHLRADGLKGKRIGVLRILSENDPDPDIQNLFNQAIADLRSNGVEIIDPVVIPGFDSLRRDQWCSEFRADLEAYLDEYVKRDTVKTLEDVIRIGTASEFARQRLEYFTTHSGRPDELPCGDAYTDSRRLAFRAAIENTMDELGLDAIVYPSWNHPPAHIRAFMDEYKGDNSQIIAPHTGQPAFTVPMGYTSEGLPAGLQILGRMYSEPTLIEIAYGYEQNTHHRIPPSL